MLIVETPPELLATRTRGEAVTRLVEVLMYGVVLGIVTVPPCPATKLPKLKVLAPVMVKGCTTVAEAGNEPVVLTGSAQDRHGISAARLNAKAQKLNLKFNH